MARDVNLRSAFIHMAGDTLSTAAVIAGGAGILLTGHNWIDPVLSLVIAALILWSSAGIVRETLNILLEGTPRNVDLNHIRAGMEGVSGVLNVHDLHCWSLGSQSRALACHVTINDIPPSESAAILSKLRHVLKDHFNICHTTIQFEHENCEVIEGCVVPMEEMASGADPGHHHGHGHETSVEGAFCASAASVLNYEFILTQSNDPVAISRYRVRMFESLRKSDDNPASSLGLLIVSLVAMSILFGFGLATLIFRLQMHARPDDVIPALVLSFGGLCAQFGMVRLLIRHLSQASEQRQ